MSKRDDGGPAFPNVVSGKVIDGLTVRQLYKATIAAKVIASYADYDSKHAIRTVELIGKWADALIAEDKEVKP